MPSYKSNVNKFKIIDKALVDGDQWYTVQVHPDLRSWVRQQPERMWQEHIDARWYKVANTFDMHSKIYTMLILRCSYENSE